MKAIRIRPLKRLVLLVLTANVLAGCSSIQTSSVYQSWERQAYAAYHVRLPAPADGVVPNIFRTVAVPGMQVAPQRTLLNPYNLGNAAVPQPPRPQVLPVQEQQYIADFYGL
ncbi:MAG: hypothetical protein RLZZ215_463 [Pseudomonadota bacterium]